MIDLVEKRRKLAIISITIAIVIILFIPMIPIEEAYTETEPYTETENYEREATYVIDARNLEEKWGFFDVYIQSDVVVRNTDSYGGTFKVTHKLYDIYGLFGSVEDSFYIGAGESYTSTVKFDTKWGQDTIGSYSVTSPTIIDQRLVTKHRTVTKYRIVTKYRTIYKSIIMCLLSI